MAIDTLEDLILHKDHNHHYCHDLESFIYVLVYAVIQKELCILKKSTQFSAKHIKKVTEHISMLFGHTDYSSTARQCCVAQHYTLLTPKSD
jgi:pyoverdine/dityrosine biosynthesis protein Dit1